jgi:hypothetical protein
MTTTFYNGGDDCCLHVGHDDDCKKQDGKDNDDTVPMADQQPTRPSCFNVVVVVVGRKRQQETRSSGTARMQPRRETSLPRKNGVRNEDGTCHERKRKRRPPVPFQCATTTSRLCLVPSVRDGQVPEHHKNEHKSTNNQLQLQTYYDDVAHPFCSATALFAKSWSATMRNRRQGVDLSRDVVHDKNKCKEDEPTRAKI